MSLQLAILDKNGDAIWVSYHFKDMVNLEEADKIIIKDCDDNKQLFKFTFGDKKND